MACSNRPRLGNIGYLGGRSIAGGKLKAKYNWQSLNVGASNESGFLALPGGDCDYNGEFYHLEEFGFWWTATEDNMYNSYSRSLHYDSENCLRRSTSKVYGFSVRCIKDQ